MRDQRPWPRWLRPVLLSFVALLVLGGIPFFMEVEINFPWRISREAAIVYGCAFLAAVVHTAYNLFRPSWSMARGLLLGYLVYSAVLVIPFITRAGTVVPGRMAAYITWFTTIVYFGLVPAIYLLAVELGGAGDQPLSRQTGGAG